LGIRLRLLCYRTGARGRRRDGDLIKTALARLCESTGGIIPANVDLARPCLLETGGKTLSYNAVAEAAAAFADAIATPRRQLAFALVANDAASVVGVFAAVLANCVVALLDPSFSNATLTHLIKAYAPDVIMQPDTHPGPQGYEQAFRMQGVGAW